MRSYISNNFFFENDFVNEEYLKGYNEGIQDAMQLLEENEEENAIETISDVYRVLSKNPKYKPFLKLFKDTIFFESENKDLVIELEVNIEDSECYIDTYHIDGEAYARLGDGALNIVNDMRGLSEKGKECKQAFINLIKDILNDKFANIRLPYSKSTVQSWINKLSKKGTVRI